MRSFSPTQSLNAFAMGSQIGTNIRDKQTDNALAPMIAQGDYKQAAQYAGERGDMERLGEMKQAIAGMDEASRKAALKRQETLARTAAGLQGIPYEQRRGALQQSMPMLQEMGIDPNQISQFDPTDDAIGQVLAQVTPMADLLKANAPPEYFAPVETANGYAQFDKSGGDPRQFNDVQPAAETLSPYQEQSLGLQRDRLNWQKNKPPSNGVTVDPDGTVRVGGSASAPGFGSAPKGKDSAIVQDADGNPVVTPGPQQQLYNKSFQSLGDYEASSEVVLQDIDKAIAASGSWTTGFIGSALKDVPGTPAHNLFQTMQSIKANVGFDKLQNMRDNSPTGGALGQVTEIELGLLQSVFGALEQSQTKEQFVGNLERLKEIKQTFAQRKREALAMDFPDLAETMDFRQEATDQVSDWNDSDEAKLQELEAKYGGAQ